MSAAETERDAMATALAGASINSKAVPVYAVAPRQVNPPCIVLEPAEPYMIKRTLSRIEQHVDAVCMVPLTQGPGAGASVDLERLEYLAEWVLSHWHLAGPAKAPLAAEVGGTQFALITIPLMSHFTI